MKNLLILSGVSGSGKSHFLITSLLQKSKLFGAEFDLCFQKTTIPPLFPESRIPLSERLLLGTWLITRDVFEFEIQQSDQDCFVLHLDIFYFLFLVTKAHPALRKMQFLEDVERFLSKEDEIADAYKAIFSTRLFRNRSVCIRTLHPPYFNAYAQWQKREVERKKTGFALKYGDLLAKVLYTGDKQGELIYERVYSAWYQAVRLANRSV